MGEVDNSRSVLERHVQTILVASTMAILSWVLLSVLDIRDKLTKFEERLGTLHAQVNTGIDDRFRGSDWRIQKERLDERHHTLRLQVDKLEERIDKVERDNIKWHHGTNK